MSSDKNGVVLVVLAFVLVFAFELIGGAASAGQEDVVVEQVSVEKEHKMDLNIWICISAAASVLGGCFGAGYAVGKVGAAAMGASAEKPELLGRALLFVGLAEGIAIYGLIVAIMLVRRLP